MASLCQQLHATGKVVSASTTTSPETSDALLATVEKTKELAPAPIEQAKQEADAVKVQGKAVTPGLAIIKWVSASEVDLTTKPPGKSDSQLCYENLICGWI